MSERKGRTHSLTMQPGTFTATAQGAVLRVWPRLPLDVATAPHPEGLRIAFAYGEPTEARDEDGEPYMTQDIIGCVVYPPAPLSAAEAAAEGERLQAGARRAAAAALAAETAGEPTEEQRRQAEGWRWATDEGTAEPIPAETMRVRFAAEKAGKAASRYLQDELYGPDGPPLTDDELQAVWILGGMFTSQLAPPDLHILVAPPEKAEPKKWGGSDLIAFTMPPAVSLEHAVADAAAGMRDNFALIDSNRRMIHTRGKAGYMVAVDYADPVASVDEALSEIGERSGLEAVFTVAAACYHALEHEGEPVHVDDVLLDIGWQRNRDGAREERAEAAARVARLYLMLNGWNVQGEKWGTFTDSEGRALDVSSRGPLFTTTVLDDPQGTLMGQPAPVGFVFRCGDFLARARQHPHVLETFGTYRELARMPRQRPADAWAVAIGLALIQRWRELAGKTKVTKAGDDNRPVLHMQKMKRRYLLSQYPPMPTPEDVLYVVDEATGKHKPHPDGARNARAYWTQALRRLRHAGVIDADTERRLQGDPTKLPKRGWGEAWLDESLDARPPEGYKADFLTLAERAETHEKKTRRRQGRKAKGGA